MPERGVRPERRMVESAHKNARAPATQIDATLVPRLARRTLSARVADELRQLILLEKLAPGAAIPERETAEALGVSRTPLREALRLLANEGLVEIEALRPPRVADPSFGDLEELFAVLGALEGLAGELACAQATEAEIREILDLADAAEALSEQGSPLDFFDADMAFHGAIVAAARNPALAETHASYNRRLWRARFVSSRRRPKRDRTLSQHRQIAAALTERAPRKAARALRQHLRSALDNIAKTAGEQRKEERP